ncbi:SMP-30/gluconolactonase/LRE family protein [Vibrio viridaestus]|uniref:SMP-30/Gluconolactonase/LRE-like region domain-containing protein n=1 Tax=Vibrio viridaestus TaxID=2487322 RepID=A0A3N9TH54_9VIBR|nr:SMP-30/gluconolactonase/LRE family protein [Vibrio viridaestus]RQW63621.1 hypothetical protein EES38_10265 [Vibrio viridaestus]
MYGRAVESGDVELVLDDLKGPNGLTFSPDGKAIYILETLAQPNTIWRYDVTKYGKLSNKSKFFVADKNGGLDGFKFDVDGNLWAGYGTNGAVGEDPSKFDGVIVINPQGNVIGHIHTPERCANLTFGGKHNNRLFMTCSHSLYALYVNTQGAK